MSTDTRDQAPMSQTDTRSQMTAAERFWYIVMCISFGAGYLAKVPAKKALAEVGHGEMTAAERFWYIVMCISFGAGYLAKVPIKKALAEVGTYPPGTVR